MPYRSKLAFVSSAASDIRFRVACVLGLLLCFVVLLLKAILHSPPAPATDLRRRLVFVKILGPNDAAYKVPGLQIQNLENAEAVLSFQNMPFGSRFFLCHNHLLSALEGYYLAGDETVITIPRGSPTTCIDAKCVAIFPSGEDQSKLIVEAYPLPPLPASPDTGLRAKRSGLASARLVYFSSPAKEPIAYLKLTLDPQFKKHAQTYPEIGGSTYLRLDHRFGPDGIDGQNYYFALPFPESQRSVRIDVVSSDYKPFRTELTIAKAKITNQRGWPVVWIAEPVEFKFSNGLKVHLLKQSLGGGTQPDLSKTSILPIYEVDPFVQRDGFLPSSGLRPVIQFHVKELRIDGVAQHSLSRNTQPTSQVTLRMTAEIQMIRRTSLNLDLPIVRSNARKLLDPKSAPPGLSGLTIRPNGFVVGERGAAGGGGGVRSGQVQQMR